LGFSVAIHVEADILLIDEILSVGDINFQRKCLEMMSNIRKSKKSIVFVSHNLSAIRGLCDRVIWLNNGVIEKDGGPEETISAYARYMQGKSEFLGDCNFVGLKTRWGSGEIRFDSIELLDLNGKKRNTYSFGEGMRVRLQYSANKKIENPAFWVGIINEDEVKITGTYFNKKRAGDYSVSGKGDMECDFKNLFLRPGNYHVMVGVYDEYCQIAYDRIGSAATFAIESQYPSKFSGFQGYGAEGIMDLENDWKSLRQDI
jgi:hypothetical protein